MQTLPQSWAYGPYTHDQGIEMTTTTETKVESIQGGLEAVAAALVWKVRDDGTGYRSLSKEPTTKALCDGTEINGDDLLILVRELHRDELPNDWRYETIYDLCWGLLQHCEAGESDRDTLHDAVWEVADDLTEICTSALLQWLADVPSRCEFEDESVLNECGSIGIADTVRQRQREEIESMGLQLIDSLDAMRR